VFILIAHLLVTLVRLARPRGLGAVAAESLAVKHQFFSNWVTNSIFSGERPIATNVVGGTDR
jgi:hypothetical protein